MDPYKAMPAKRCHESAPSFGTTSIQRTGEAVPRTCHGPSSRPRVRHKVNGHFDTRVETWRERNKTEDEDGCNGLGASQLASPVTSPRQPATVDRMLSCEEAIHSSCPGSSTAEHEPTLPLSHYRWGVRRRQTNNAHQGRVRYLGMPSDTSPDH